MAGLHIALFCLLAFLPKGSTQYICYTQAVADGSLVCFSSTPQRMVATTEECCLTDGYFFEPGGAQSCTACIVFGWSSSRGLDAVPRGTFTAVEQDERYVLPVGFIKGGIFAILWNELEFSIGVREGTATANDDYSVATESATYMDFRTRLLVDAEIFLRADCVALEDNETFSLILEAEAESPAAGFLTTAMTSTNTFVNLMIEITIVDIDGVTINIEQTLYNATEGADPFVELCAVLTKGVLEKDAIVTFSTSDGPATSVSPSDYDAVTVQLTFDAVNDRRCVDVTIVNDSIVENTENFFGNLMTLDPGVRLSPDRAEVQIFEDSNDGVTIGFEQTVYSATAGIDASVELCAVLTQGTLERETIVMFSTSDGTATALAPADYGETIEDLTFDGSTGRQCVTVPIINDDILEDTESFTTNFTTSDSAVTLNPDLARVDIFEDPNDGVTIGFEMTVYSATEGVDGVELCAVFLAGTLEREAVVTFSTSDGTATSGAPTDYTGTIAALTFDGSTDRNCVNVAITDYNILEDTENFFGTLTTTDSGVTLNPDRAQVNIFEDPDDGVTIGFERTVYNAIEGVDASVELCAVLLAGTLEREAVVTFSTSDGTATSIAPADYGGTIEDLTFDGSTSRKCVDVPIINDDILEDTESFTTNFTTSDSAVTLNLDLAQVDIFEDPNDGVTIGFEQTVYSATEGVDASVELCAVLLDGTLEREAVVTFFTSDGTATSGAPSDYGEATAEFTYDGDNSRRCVSVSIENDDILEDTEDFFGSLTTTDMAVTLDPERARVEISKDPNDGVTIGFERILYNATEGEDPSVELCAVLMTGTLEREAVVTFSTRDGSATSAAPVHYNATTVNFVFDADNSRRCVTVPIEDADILKDTENFFGDLTTIDPAVILLPDMAEVEISEDPDDGVTIGFEMTVYSATEGVDASVELCAVFLAGTLEREAVVMFSTSDGAATSGAPTDYTGTSADLTFDGSTDKNCVDVPIINDDILEDIESFTASLTTSDSAVTLTPDLARVDISEGSIDIMCLDPPAIVNGMRTFTGNSVGDTATYTCDSGFELIGGATATCTEVDVNTAEFTPVPPVCSTLCPDPPAIINGIVTFTGNSVGDTATYTCNSDFDLIGDPVTTCAQVNNDSAAFLSVPPPESLCPDPAAIINGMVTISGNSVGDTATYTCDSGFELIGVTTTTCTEVDVNTAEFTSVPPVCSTIDIVIGFDPVLYSINEADGTARLRITKAGNNPQPVSVDFSTASGSAMVGTDFMGISQTLTFRTSDTEMSVTVPLIDDNVLEMTESFFGTLTHPVGNVDIVKPRAQVDIIDNDVSSCMAEETVSVLEEDEGITNLLRWPATQIGQTAVVNCSCGNITIASASRLCGADIVTGATWENVNDSDCRFTKTVGDICQLVTADQEVDTLVALGTLTVDNENIGTAGVLITTCILENLSPNIIQKQNISMIESFLTVVDNLLAVDPSDLQESQLKSNTSASALFEMTSDGVINSKELLFVEHQNSTASITLPTSALSVGPLLANMKTNTSIRITNSVYVNDLLFLRREEESQRVGSIIISGSVSSHNRSEILDPPVHLTFMKNPNVENGTNATCSFWDPTADNGFGDWSSRGCAIVNETEEGVVCECDHLTNFAILLDVSPKANETSVSVGITKTLETLSYIGAIISIFFLTLTVATYLSSKKLRSSEPSQLLINLCFGFLGIYIAYIIALHATAVSGLCVLAGVLVHYFLLATFFIMAADAILIVNKLIFVFFKIRRYVAIASIISWSIPVIIAIATVAPDYKNYLEINFCRPYGIQFYVGLLAPFLAIYIFNWIVYIIIMVFLINHHFCKSNDTVKRPHQGNKIRQQFRNAITLSLLFGLGWAFGLPATEGIDNVSVRTAFQVLFIIVTGFQGLYIFIMQCLTGNNAVDARAEWQRWFYCITCRPGHIHAYTLSRTSATERMKKKQKFSEQIETSTLPSSKALPSVTEDKLEHAAVLEMDTKLEEKSEAVSVSTSFSKTEKSEPLPKVSINIPADDCSGTDGSSGMLSTNN